MLHPSIIEKVENFIKAGIDAKRAVGLAVGVIVAGEVVYCRGFGVRSANEQSPVTKDTLFHTASVTKPFVATAILQLVEKDRFSLETPVCDLLPYFALSDPRYRAITLRHLLTHTAGLPDWESEDAAFNDAFAHPEFDVDSLERHIRNLAQIQLVSEPGEKYGYSNYGYHILGDVVAKTYNLPFAECIKRYVLAPSGMQSSVFDYRASPAHLFTVGHIAHETDKTAQVSAIYPYHQVFGPSSSLHSSAAELCLWAQVQLNRGSLQGRRLLRAANIEMMWERQIALLPDKPEEGFRGLSWYLYDQYDRRIVAHHGGDIGFASLFQFFPDDNAAVVVLANTDWGVFDPGPIVDMICEGLFATL